MVGRNAYTFLFCPQSYALVALMDFMISMFSKLTLERSRYFSRTKNVPPACRKSTGMQASPPVAGLLKGFSS